MGFSGFSKIIIFLGLLLSLSSAFALIDAPSIHVMPFENLHYPIKITKPDLQWMLQKAMDGMYGKTFVDMGDVTDLMHGHVILRQKKSQSLDIFDKFILESPELIDVAQNPELEPLAILFHTHEFSELRKGMPYIGPNGELDAYNRNWLLFLIDTGKYHRGDLVDANEFYKQADGTKPFTIEAYRISSDLFGFEIGRWSYSVYFFRVNCEDSDAVAGHETLNLTEVYNSIKKERVCMALLNYTCRSNSGDAEHCSGQELKGFDIFKDWVAPPLNNSLN